MAAVGSTLVSGSFSIEGSSIEVIFRRIGASWPAVPEDDPPAHFDTTALALWIIDITKVIIRWDQNEET